MITMFRSVFSVGLLGLVLAFSSCTSGRHYHHEVSSNGPVYRTSGKNAQVVTTAPRVIASSCHAKYFDGEDACDTDTATIHGSAPVYYREAYGYPGAFTNQSWEANYNVKACCYYRPKEYVSAGYGCGYYQGQGFPFTW